MSMGDEQGKIGWLPNTAQGDFASKGCTKAILNPLLSSEHP